ncbi:MAG: hypothetical protein IPO89_14945 [Actinomycetales bacterium]|nr:hypothetical protein [Candidatus Lutibacillus vidarii]HRC00629.1 hypothetical protein [Dermatophilaceae bacterium]
MSAVADGDISLEARADHQVPSEKGGFVEAPAAHPAAGAHSGPAGRWAHLDYEAEIMAVVLAELG